MADDSTQAAAPATTETAQTEPATTETAQAAPAATEPATAESAPAAAPTPAPAPAAPAQNEAQPPKGNHRVAVEGLLKAGVHFGHLTSRWNPKMKNYVFMERNGIHIIDLTQTQAMLDAAAGAASRFAKQGKNILFAGTKKQAREILKKHAKSCDSPYVVERWLGGTLTNFQTIRKSIRRMEDLAKMEEDGTMGQLKKKERLMKNRERAKLDKVLSGIANMPRLPGALFVVDINREHIAVKEARKLGIPIIAMVDTNCDPDLVQHVVPANDDALKSIDLVAGVIAAAISEGKSARAEQLAAESAEKAKRAADKAAAAANKDDGAAEEGEVAEA